MQFFFCVLQCTYDVFVAPMNSTISTLILFQKTATISFLLDTVYLDFLSCLVNVCASTALIALWFQNSQMEPRFHHLLLV
jgi:hypothetical protein